MRASWVARVLGLTIALSLVTATATRGDSSSTAQLEGLRLYQAGRFAEAIPYFNQVLARHPNNVRILNVRGICYLRDGATRKGASPILIGSIGAAYRPRESSPTVSSRHRPDSLSPR